MSWSALLEDEQFKTLFENSPLTEYLNRVDRQLVEPSTPHERTLVLRGERAGILRVIALVEELAERESVPPDTAETEEQRDLRRVERAMGYRPVFRPKAQRVDRFGGQR